MAGPSTIPDEAELAAAAFLARYQGRTLDAYRDDLRAFFQWAADEAIEVLGATRPQIECYVRAMEARGLAATTIDRRVSTVCGFYRFAYIDGRIPSNPAQCVRRPKVHPSDARGQRADRLALARSRATTLLVGAVERSLGRHPAHLDEVLLVELSATAPLGHAVLGVVAPGRVRLRRRRTSRATRARRRRRGTS